MEIETFPRAYLHDLERSVKNLSLQFTKVEYNAASATSEIRCQGIRYLNQPLPVGVFPNAHIAFYTLLFLWIYQSRLLQSWSSRKIDIAPR